MLTATILSHLHCNTRLLTGLPGGPLALTVATAVHLEFKSDHIISLSGTLLRLPMSLRIKVKVLMMARESFDALVSLPCSLGPSSLTLTQFPGTPRALLPRAFCTHCSPSWNALPWDLYGLLSHFFPVFT